MPALQSHLGARCAERAVAAAGPTTEGGSAMTLTVTKVRTWLLGKKTYIGIIAGSVYACLCIAGVTENNELVWTLIAAWTTVSFRAALG